MLYVKGNRWRHLHYIFSKNKLYVNIKVCSLNFFLTAFKFSTGIQDTTVWYTLWFFRSKCIWWTSELKFMVNRVTIFNVYIKCKLIFWLYNTQKDQINITNKLLIKKRFSCHLTRLITVNANVSWFFLNRIRIN